MAEGAVELAQHHLREPDHRIEGRAQLVAHLRQKLVNAGGKVTYNGAPLPAAQVVFVPEGDQPTAIATTDDQGQFTISTEGRPGAVAGNYKVAVTAIKMLKEIKPEEAASLTNEQIYANQKSLIPEKYNNTVSSGLTATVSEDPAANQYTFDLK